MNISRKDRPRGYGENIVGLLSVGFFFLLVGVIFATTPGLFDRILTFLRDFDIVRVPNTRVLLPAPVHLGIHSAVYSAVAQFCLVWGLFQIVLLALRFAVHSPWSKKAEVGSNLVFWLGASYLIYTLLGNLSITAKDWFAFWSVLIILVGLSLVVRAILLAVHMK